MRKWLAALFVLIGLLPLQAFAVAISPCTAPTQCIQTAISANPTPGTAFQLASGTWHGQIFSTVTGDTFTGAGVGVTILNGDAVNAQMTNGNSDGSTNVTFRALSITNYNANVSECQSAAIVPWSGWLLDHIDVSGNNCSGVYMEGGHILGGTYNNNLHSGINGNLSLGSTDSQIIIEKAEVSGNNVRGDDPNGDVAGMKLVGNGTGSGSTPLVQYMYIHGNHSVGLWCDVNCPPVLWRYNTVINNDVNGIMVETSISGGSVFHNVINGNGTATTVNGHAACCGAAVYNSFSSGTTIDGNNISVPSTSGNARGIIYYEDTSRPADDRGCSNNTSKNNSVTFLGTLEYTGMQGCVAGFTSTTSNFNTFYGSGSVGTANHWAWNASPTTFAAMQTASGQEASGSVITGNGSVPGCLAQDCSGDPTVTGGTGESASGTTICLPTSACTSSAQIVDSGLNIWTLRADGVALENGNQAASNSGVGLILYYNHTVYTETTDLVWWFWSGASWVQLASGDPRVASGLTFAQVRALFNPGQPAGSITPQDMQSLIDFLASRLPVLVP